MFTYTGLPLRSGSWHNVNNRFRDSCGAFILSEIRACLVPGDPEGAARYAFGDACVDHAGEGLYAEVFCAAVQSAAFVVQDTATLIGIGLSYIPENCGISRAGEPRTLRLTVVNGFLMQQWLRIR